MSVLYYLVSTFIVLQALSFGASSQAQAQEFEPYCVKVTWRRVNGRSSPWNGGKANLMCKGNYTNQEGQVLEKRGNWRYVQFHLKHKTPGCENPKKLWIYRKALGRTGKTTHECLGTDRTEGGLPECVDGVDCNKKKSILKKSIDKVTKVLSTASKEFDRQTTTPDYVAKEMFGTREKKLAKEGFYDKIQKYENSNGVEKMIATLKRNSKKCLETSCVEKLGSRAKRKGSGYSVDYCYRYLKYGMVGGGFLKSKWSWPSKSYSQAVSAKLAGAPLNRMGFTNVMKKGGYNARTAPKGAVLVYSGGTHGHIEVKMGKNSYGSDFTTRRPITENPRLKRRLIGVYVKI